MPVRNISFQDLFSNPLAPRQHAPPSNQEVHDNDLTYLTTEESKSDLTQKSSIGFILGNPATGENQHFAATTVLEPADDSNQDARQQQLHELRLPSLPRMNNEALGSNATGKRKKKRKARICKEENCEKYVVDHGLCIRHGGGKRCNVEGCNCRAQNRGLCWKHGGYTICKVDGCSKRAKSRGICWSHGGGTRCKTEDCSKIAVSLGRCWAHGGGKRCSIETCKKPASERTNNFCTDHYAWYQQQQQQQQQEATHIRENY